MMSFWNKMTILFVDKLVKGSMLTYLNDLSRIKR